jgi:uncharacterized protein (DUF488 family)
MSEDTKYQGRVLYTIGHSHLEMEAFTGMLKKHGVQAVADVRSAPYCRWAPHFNREKLSGALKTAGFDYVFLGDQLGGRPRDPGVYSGGRVDYRKLANAPYFQEGIRRLIKGSEKYTIAVMCSEKDPVNCHRALLIGRCLERLEVPVRHILANGSVETQADMEGRMMRGLRLPESDLYASREDLLERAYETKESEIAFHSTEGEDYGER